MKFSKRQHVVEAEQDGGAADDDDDVRVDVRLDEFVTFFHHGVRKFFLADKMSLFLNLI